MGAYRNKDPHWAPRNVSKGFTDDALTNRDGNLFQSGKIRMLGGW